MIESTDQEICVAVLPKGDPRGKNWKAFFWSMRVPVREGDPVVTVLPDGSTRLCYFVDFSAMSDDAVPRMISVALARAGKNKESAEGAIRMLRDGIYPVLAEGVTIVRDPFRIWV